MTSGPVCHPNSVAWLLAIRRPQLAHGTRLIIDQQQPAQQPYKICFPVGCMADYPVTDDMIAKMKKDLDGRRKQLPT